MTKKSLGGKKISNLVCTILLPVKTLKPWRCYVHNMASHLFIYHYIHTYITNIVCSTIHRQYSLTLFPSIEGLTIYFLYLYVPTQNCFIEDFNLCLVYGL